jgi:hypothetical protein
VANGPAIAVVGYVQLHSSAGQTPHKPHKGRVVYYKSICIWEETLARVGVASIIDRTKGNPNFSLSFAHSLSLPRQQDNRQCARLLDDVA